MSHPNNDSENEKARRQSGRREGEFRKQRKLSVLAARREVYVNRGRRALLTKMLTKETATMDDVRDVVTLPPDINPKLFGAVPGTLAFAGIIKADGSTKTSRPMAHARTGLTVWRLVDRAAAEQWLIDHPDRPASTEHHPGGDPSLWPLDSPMGQPTATPATSGDIVQDHVSRDRHQQTLFGGEGE